MFEITASDQFQIWMSKENTNAPGEFMDFINVSDRMDSFGTDSQMIRLKKRSQNVVSEGLQIFPNPATTEVILKFNDGGQSQDVQILDSTGKVVKRASIKSEESIQLENLPSGLYMVRLNNAQSNESIVKRLIIQE
jgi:hypothetical protein